MSPGGVLTGVERQPAAVSPLPSVGARNLKGEWSHREFCVDGPSDSSFVLGAPWGGGGPSVQVVSEVSSRLDGRERGAGGGSQGEKHLEINR